VPSVLHCFTSHLWLADYMSLNIFPFALNVCAGHSFHFSNSLALFFSCSNADASTSARGMSGSAATESTLIRSGER